MTVFRIVDLETTGIDPNESAIVEIATVDLVGNRIVEPHQSLIKPPHKVPPESSAIHHLTDNDLVLAPQARDVIPEMLGDVNSTIFVAHNSAFERSFLEPFMPNGIWICTYKCSLRVWPEAPGHSNQVLRYWRIIDGGDELMPPHRALPDCYVTAHILADLLRYAEVRDMLSWTQEPALLPRCPIGREKGYYDKPWAEVDSGFLRWMLGAAEMNPDYIWNARHELDRRARVQSAQVDDKTRENREEYIKLACRLARESKSVDELNDWFVGQVKEKFPTYGIVKSDDFYKRIVKACADHKATLLKQPEAVAA